MSAEEKRLREVKWNNGTRLHWIINPGLAFNELILGQRIPKVTLLDETSSAPFAERSFVPCPHCNTVHSSLTWSHKNNTGLRNWFGLYCPNCGGVIPCLRNGVAGLLLVLTLPIWWWFRKPLYNRWIAAQPERFQNLNLELEPREYTVTHWLLQGLIFGVLMFLIMALLLPTIQGRSIETSELAIEFGIWMIGGLVYGFLMRYILSRKGKEETS